jgi:hypothetical protein
MSIPRKHAELIKAWADGEEIEFLNARTGNWEHILFPEWYAQTLYRIKRESRKPDRAVIFYESNHSEYGRTYTEYAPVPANITKHNLKLTFDGETGRLKAAEVIG